MKKSILVSMVAMAAFAAGCGGPESIEGEETLSSTEQAAEQTYCVAQSYASAVLLGSPWDLCPTSLSGATSQLSNGHPVHIQSYCNGGSTYVKVKSLWNTNYYFMRRDALTPC